MTSAQTDFRGPVDDELVGRSRRRTVIYTTSRFAALPVILRRAAVIATVPEQSAQQWAKMFGLTLGAARTEIAWSDIVRAGRTMTGYWYVESGDGRRVYWSYLCAGCDALWQALRGHCPTLQFDFHLPR